MTLRSMERASRAEAVRAGAAQEQILATAPAAGADPALDALVALVRDARARPAERTWRSRRTSAGLDERSLRALLLEHYHTTPANLLRRARVAAASRAMAKRGSASSEAGAAAGFPSERDYERDFTRATGLRPAAYAALAGATELVLELPRGYCADAVLRVNGRDPDGPAERVEGNRLVKAFDA